MFAVDRFPGPVNAQTVVIELAGNPGAAEIPWHDCPGRRVLPGPRHLRVIRTTVFF